MALVIDTITINDGLIEAFTGSNLTAGSGISLTPSGGDLEISATGSGTGDVVGPASSTEKSIARFADTTGKLLEDSTVIIDDDGIVWVYAITANETDPAQALALYGESSGTFGVGFGVFQTFNHGDQSTHLAQLGATGHVYTDITPAAESTQFVVTVLEGGSLTTACSISQSAAAFVGTLSAANFSGSSSGTNTGDQTNITGNAATVTVADAGGDTTCWVLLATSQTGNQSPRTDAGFTYNATSNEAAVAVPAGTLTGNTLASGVTASSLTSFGSSPSLTGTPTAPTAAGGTNTTQIATTAFVTAAVSSAVSGLLDFKGSTDCSGNPDYPAASKGDAYIVSVAGKIGGASGTSVEVGDWYIALADNAGGTEAAVGSSWGHMEHNLVGALLASNNLSDVASVPTARTNLGGTTVGQALFTLTNPGAITFLRVNADNSVTARSAANFRGDIGATTIGGSIFTLTNPSAITFLRVNADNTVTARSAADFKADLSLNNVENTALSTWAGSSNVTTLGTITTGVWNGTDIAVADGGTGRSSHTAYAVLCGGTTTTAAQQSIASVGTAGQVLTSAGAGALPTMSDPITATKGESVLGSDYTLASSNGTYDDSGLGVTLPSAGTYDVYAIIKGVIITGSGDGYIVAKLRNTTDSADITNSETQVVYGATAGTTYATNGFIRMQVTVAASKTIKVYVARFSAASWTYSVLSSSSAGRCVLGYIKIAP